MILNKYISINYRGSTKLSYTQRGLFKDYDEKASFILKQIDKAKGKGLTFDLFMLKKIQEFKYNKSLLQIEIQALVYRLEKGTNEEKAKVYNELATINKLQLTVPIRSHALGAIYKALTNREPNEGKKCLQEAKTFLEKAQKHSRYRTIKGTISKVIYSLKTFVDLYASSKCIVPNLFQKTSLNIRLDDFDSSDGDQSVSSLTSNSNKSVSVVSKTFNGTSSQFEDNINYFETPLDIQEITHQNPNQSVSSRGTFCIEHKSTATRSDDGINVEQNEEKSVSKDRKLIIGTKDNGKSKPFLANRFFKSRRLSVKATQKKSTPPISSPTVVRDRITGFGSAPVQQSASSQDSFISNGFSSFYTWLSQNETAKLQRKYVPISLQSEIVEPVPSANSSLSEHKDSTVSDNQLPVVQEPIVRVDENRLGVLLSESLKLNDSDMHHSDDAELCRLIKNMAESLNQEDQLSRVIVSSLRSSDETTRLKGVRLYCYVRELLNPQEFNFSDFEKIEIARQSFYRDNGSHFGYKMSKVEKDSMSVYYDNFGKVPVQRKYPESEEKTSENRAETISRTEASQISSFPLDESIKTSLFKQYNSLKKIPTAYEVATQSKNLHDDATIAKAINDYAGTKVDLFAHTLDLLKSPDQASRLLGVRLFGYMFAKEQGEKNSKYSVETNIIAQFTMGSIVREISASEELSCFAKKEYKFTPHERMMIAFQFHYTKTNKAFEAPSGMFSSTLTKEARESYNRALALEFGGIPRDSSVAA